MFSSNRFSIRLLVNFLFFLFRVETVLTKLEDFSVEVFIEIFQRLSLMELLQSFYNLNFRLNTIIEQRTPVKFDFWQLTDDEHLLFEQFIQKLNLRQVNSLDINLHWQRNSILERLQSIYSSFTCIRLIRILNISDEDSELIINLLSCISLSFIQLKTISIGYNNSFDCINCIRIFQKILASALLLTSLQHVTFISSHCSPVEDERALYKEGFPVVNKNQLTNIKYLHLKKFYFPSLLLTVLQNLQSLHLEDVQCLMNDSMNDVGNIKLLNLVKLCLIYYSSSPSFEWITVLLKLMPNLQSISTKTHHRDLEDGNEWSQILQLHCSKLMKFHLEIYLEDGQIDLTTAETTFGGNSYWQERSVHCTDVVMEDFDGYYYHYLIVVRVSKVSFITSF
jgi:hypothetical protein